MSRALPWSAALTLVLATWLPLAAQAKPTIAQFMSPPSPLEIVSAAAADRVAWVTYEEGMRNVYTAAAPGFAAVRLTSFLEDDGIEVSGVQLSTDGRIAIFVRGSAPNRRGWIANPLHDPDGQERAVWAVRTAGGPAWRLGAVTSPLLSPDGSRVVFLRDGQIWQHTVARGAAVSAVDTAGVPFIRAWGEPGNLRWSPDGSKLAFVSQRVNHAYIAIYDVRERTLRYLAPDVDCDSSPTWSPDGRRVAFLRRPGMPFGRQARAGTGGIANPQGPAMNATGRGRGSSAFPGCTGFGGGRGGTSGDAEAPGGNTREIAGLHSATLRGGHTLALMVADVETGEAREAWRNRPDDPAWSNINSITWAGESVVFSYVRPDDEWDRWFKLSVDGRDTEPVLLTTTDGLIENATSIAFSADGRTLYYCTNADDIERRHIWAVPTGGGRPRRVSMGTGIETHPVALSSGDQLAVLYFNARQPASVALVPAQGGEVRVVYPTPGPEFPVDAHVVPEIVHTTAADGLEISNQLFLPRDMRRGERRPAMIFVHGGPVRQMLPAYHYMQFYHWAYAFNQWLASEGYVVLSINFRSGIGYGRSFRQAPNTNARGNSEYQDVVAGARYLQSRSDVDPARIGIWGLSYGGLLTSQALARNSDIFTAGADLAGVHLYGNTLDTTAVSYRSSAIAAIDQWKSPVFLVHGDDDRNVDFSQTVGLVQLLRARNVHYELMVFPDDLHESQIHAYWIETWNRMGDFFKRFVWERKLTNQ
ncbi:MAG: prolyl oligopeptidase family serine peptidase [Gemmatimonadetes bacterium]|nr:prolyl oligopeptidase family serine peptidase [Gemmatimonadota bacterium]